MRKGLMLNKHRLALGFMVLLSAFAAVPAASADTPVKPVVLSFTASPDSIDLATAQTTLTLDLIVSNPTGIASTQTSVNLTNGFGSTLFATIVRTDSPIISSLSTVEFRGIFTIPSTMLTGVYKATAAPITGLSATGATGYQSDAATATTSSNVVGAENSILIRSNGYLNYNFTTFSGPTWNKTSGISFVNQRYLTAPSPIWKVGETFNPIDYYELRVPTLSLKIRTNTPGTCTTDTNILKLVAVGSCSFSVYTDRSADYQSFQDDESIDITPARVKPTYYVGTIPTQTSTQLPLSIQGPFVYGPLGLIVPVSVTPSVCFPVGTYISVVSGGSCTLNYSSPASSTYLASDIFPLTFQISRTTQTLTFTLPSISTLSSKSLQLTAITSNGLPTSFQSDTPSICSVSGNSLTFVKLGKCTVEALQSGTTTINPASISQTMLITGGSTSKNVISCVKAGKSKVFVGTKCPTGYKVKK